MQKSNPKFFLNTYKKKRERIVQIKKEAGDIIESGEELSKVLNDYYLSVKKIRTPYR